MKKLIERPSKLPPKKSPVKATNIVDHVANTIKSLTLPAPTPIIPANHPAAAQTPPVPQAAGQRFTPVAPTEPFNNGASARRNFPAAQNSLPVPPKQTGEAGAKGKAAQTHVHIHLNG
jgi:hypothetical protein